MQDMSGLRSVKAGKLTQIFGISHPRHQLTGNLNIP